MKPLEDMTEPELRAIMHEACERLKFTFPKGTGFIVLASTFGGGIAQYASNVERGDAEKWMLETIVRWQRGDYIPRVGS